ncbi:hypothetical protein Patl1_23738 [Pistacia atlantica]|uniref:Uncharacterized protein n=1 Tax=Pistacia atlantica TaxID=434234 RepID=A0ACC0ZWZ3_9ROSI|nr:hypothetical protein Patl1_23738 [Pistacia atlantica]
MLGWVNSEADVNFVYEQASSNPSLTLAKAMLLNEQTSLGHSSRCLTGNSCDRSSFGLLNLAIWCKINATDSRRQTPLHRCILRGRPPFAKLLLMRAADPRAVNGEDKSPLELAVESNFNDSDVLAIFSDWNG